MNKLIRKISGILAIVIIFTNIGYGQALGKEPDILGNEGDIIELKQDEEEENLQEDLDQEDSELPGEGENSQEEAEDQDEDEDVEESTDPETGAGDKDKPREEVLTDSGESEGLEEESSEEQEDGDIDKDIKNIGFEGEIETREDESIAEVKDEIDLFLALANTGVEKIVIKNDIEFKLGSYLWSDIKSYRDYGEEYELSSEGIEKIAGKLEETSKNNGERYAELRDLFLFICEDIRAREWQSDTSIIGELIGSIPEDGKEFSKEAFKGKFEAVLKDEKAGLMYRSYIQQYLFGIRGIDRSLTIEGKKDSDPEGRVKLTLKEGESCFFTYNNSKDNHKVVFRNLEFSDFEEVDYIIVNGNDLDESNIGADVLIENCDFIGNDVKESLVKNVDKMHIINTKFIGNEHYGEDGDLVEDDWDGIVPDDADLIRPYIEPINYSKVVHNMKNLTVENTIFEENIVRNGGGIYNEGDLTLKSRVEFINNQADLGGAIYLNKGSITGRGNFIFKNNKGPAIQNNIESYWLDGVSIDLDGVLFEDNRFNNEDGSEVVANDIELGNNANLSIKNGSFIRNDKSIEGQSILIKDDGLIYYRPQTRSLDMNEMLKDKVNSLNLNNVNFKGYDKVLAAYYIEETEEYYEISNKSNYLININNSIIENPGEDVTIFTINWKFDEDLPVSVRIENTFVGAENIKGMAPSEGLNLALDLYNNTIDSKSIDFTNTSGLVVHNTFKGDNKIAFNGGNNLINNILMAREVSLGDKILEKDEEGLYKSPKNLDIEIMEEEKIRELIFKHLIMDISKNFDKLSQKLIEDMPSFEDEIYVNIIHTTYELVEREINNAKYYTNEDEVELSELKEHFSENKKIYEDSIRDLDKNINGLLAELEAMTSEDVKEDVSFFMEDRALLAIMESVFQYIYLNDALLKVDLEKLEDNEEIEFLEKMVDFINKEFEKLYGDESNKIDTMEKFRQDGGYNTENHIKIGTSGINMLLQAQGLERGVKEVLEDLGEVEGDMVGGPEYLGNRKYFKPVVNSLAKGFPRQEAIYGIGEDMLGQTRGDEVTLGAVEGEVKKPDSKPEEKPDKPEEKPKPEKKPDRPSTGGGGSSKPKPDPKPEEKPDKPEEKPSEIRPEKPSTPEEEDKVNNYKNGDRTHRDELIGYIIEEKIDYDLNKTDHLAYLKGYPDKTVRPEGNVTREEAAMVFYRLMEPEFRQEVETRDHNFTDVEKGSWSEKAIATLAKGEMITGYKDGSFKPRQKITRAEVSSMIAKLTDTIILPTDFDDIVEHWAEDYINSVEREGWIRGYEDGSFRPNDLIKRSEFTTMVNSILERQVKKENILEGIKTFKDLGENKWYYEQMVEASNGHKYIIEDGIEIWTELDNRDFE